MSTDTSHRGQAHDSCNDAGACQLTDTVLDHQWYPARLRGERTPVDATMTLVFIHGIAGSAAVWDAPLRALDTQANLLLLDCLGFGNSPKPDGDYTPWAHVQAIDATLCQVADANEIVCVHLVGHSMGSLLCAHLAANWRSTSIGKRARLAGVTLLSLPVYASMQEAVQRVGEASLFNRWMALETPLARVTCWLMCRIRPWLMPLMPRLLPQLPPQVARDSLKHTWRSYSESLREVVLKSRAADLLETLSRNAVAVELIHGLHDTLAPADALRTTAQSHHLPVIWLDGTHDIVWTHSEEIATAIRSFMQTRVCR